MLTFEKTKVLLDAYYETNRTGVWFFNADRELLYSSFFYSAMFAQAEAFPCSKASNINRQGVFLQAGAHELYSQFECVSENTPYTVFIGPVFFMRPQSLQDFEMLSFSRSFPHSVLQEICNSIPITNLMNHVALTRFLMLALSGTAPARSELEEEIHILSARAGQHEMVHDSAPQEENCSNAYLAEKMFLTYVSHGDTEKVKSILAGIKKIRTGRMSDDAVTQKLFDMVCSTTLVTRAALQGGLEPETAFSLSDFYIQKASRMKHPSDLTIISTQMLLDFTERMSKLKKRQAVYSLPIQKCINYISLHFHEKITVQQLSKYTHMSISHLSRIFKSETGISIQGFIQNTRINEAKELLLNTDYPFSTISNMLNFSSQSYFISVFKSVTGTTPKEFRRRHG